MTTYLVFIATYILIAARRLAFLPIGRPPEPCWERS